ncbi:MAG: pyruvate dehydrogenase complex dihydrolipoamide acetyltransferase [bacterium]
MPIPITMPALSPTMEEGTLVNWLVKEGDRVEPGDVIAEIETDKATMEVEAVDEGVVGKILVPEGTEGVKVNATIAVLLEEGEDASALEEGGVAARGEGNGQAREPQRAEEEAARAAARPEPGGNGPARQPSAAPPREDGDGRIFSSPLARRIAEQEGVDLREVRGSGPGGRIIKADVEAAARGAPRRPEQPAAEARPAAARAEAEAPSQVPAIAPGEDMRLYGIEPGTYDEYPLDGMRKTIAKRLTAAKQEIPHYYLTVDCEIDALLAMRKDLNARSPEGENAYKISVNDFIVRASALALMRVPAANASWTEKAILRHHHADVSVAVALDGGLITPIVRQAETKGLATIAREMQDMAERARNRKLMPEEYLGGTFSVSNLGMFGIKHFTGVINPPHAMLLAVGAGEQRPVVKNGELTTATIMTVTLSCDHRVVDGALGAEWLKIFKDYVEDPVTMML